MKRIYEKTISEAGVRIVVANIPGTSLKRRLERYDLFKEKRCEKERCLAETIHAADSTPPAFKMRVTGVYGGDATKRLISEPVKINHTAGR